MKEESLEQVKKPETPFHLDRIEGDKIILDGKGRFPKKVIIIIEPGKIREYRIVRTSKGGYQLT
jgi:hypothetical protein